MAPHDPSSRLNSGWIYRDRVDRASAGQPALAYYVRRYRHSSAAEWRDRFAAGQIRLGDRPIAAEWILERGQTLAYHRPPWAEPAVPLDFDILYKDADLLAIAKPSGLPVLPGGGFLEHTLLGQLQRRYPDPPAVPVHRLGRGTSGLVLLARSPLARSNLTQQLRDRQVEKLYRALADGWIDRDVFSVEVPIGKRSHPTLGYVYGAVAAGTGAFARSDCRVLARDRGSGADGSGDRSLVEVSILTGRPHQIRIHLAAAGFPLVGDPLYEPGGRPRGCGPDPHSLLPSGDRAPRPGDCGYHLHARALAFCHPRSGDRLQLSCPPPPELALAIECETS